MAFVIERDVLIGNAIARAQFEVINAKEAQELGDQTRLWHIYKAQTALKQAAALLVEDGKQGETNNNGELNGN